MSLKLIYDKYGRKYETQGKGPPGSKEPGRSSSISPGPISLGIPLTRLLREIAATIDIVLTSTWTAFASHLGYTEDDIGTSITEPTSKIFKLLQRDAAQFDGNVDKWWEKFLECLNGYGNADLTSQVQEVYNRWKVSQMQHSSQSFEKVYPALDSGLLNLSIGDEYNQDNDIVPDRPEISMEINVVAEALDKVSSNPRTGDIAKWLRDGVPRIIQIERELKSQKALRGIFEKETHDLKDQLNKKQAELEVKNNECLNLRIENEELKKVKQDEHLNEFDFVTRKEAHDIKEEEKIQKREDHRSPKDDTSPEALQAELTKAKQDNAHLKKQIDEIVKVNHSWDEHYKKMKTQYEKQTIGLRKELDTLLAVGSENDQLKEELTKLQQALCEDQKKHDLLLLQAKERIDTLEKENGDKQEEIVILKSRFDRVQGYARTLTSQRKDAEDEISRLNQALAQKMTISSSKHGTAEIQKSQTSPILSQSAAPAIPPSMESLLATSLERPPAPAKRIESMSEAELKEELEVLRQQTDVYRSDFEHERQDRQRIMGELDETKKELKKYQRELKAPKPQVIRSKQRQLLEDEQYAQQLQREEDALLNQGRYPYKPTTQKRVQPRYQAPQYQYQNPGQPGYKDYYTVQDIQNIQVPHKGLVPHGGTGGRGQQYYRGPPNYAANDMWIDGNGGVLEIDGEDETDGNKPDGPDDNSSQGTSEDNTCPRCKRSFSHDDEFAVHLDRCVTD